MQITFDDNKTLADFNMAVLKGYEKPLMPSISNKSTKINGRIGAWDFGDELGVITEKYSIICLEQDPIKREECFSKFLSYITDKNRKPRLMKISFSIEPDKFIYGKLSKSLVPRRYNSSGDFDLEIINHAAIKYANSDEYDPEVVPNYDEVRVGDYYANSQSMEWLYRKSYAGFYNYSSFSTSVKFNIRGRIKNASITHQQNNITLTLPDMKSGNMIIDTKTMSIKVNGNDSLIGSNHEYFDIIPGRNSFVFESDNPDAKVKFEWLHEF